MLGDCSIKWGKFLNLKSSLQIIKFYYSVVDDECYSYEAAVGRCKAKKNDNLRTLGCSLRADGKDSLYKMGPAYSLNNETDIMWEIFYYGPVQGERLISSN